MFRMLARRRSQISVAAGTDQVLWGMSLPSDTVVHDIKGEVHVIGSADQLYRRGTFYGMVTSDG